MGLKVIGIDRVTHTDTSGRKYVQEPAVEARIQKLLDKHPELLNQYSQCELAEAVQQRMMHEAEVRSGISILKKHLGTMESELTEGRYDCNAAGMVNFQAAEVQKVLTHLLGRADWK